MAFRLESREPFEVGVRRVAREQIEAALAGLDRGIVDDPEEAVHDVRKRCKKLRGLARMIRFALGDRYAPFNADLRDAARELAPMRDAHVLRDTVADPGEGPSVGLVASVRAVLARRAWVLTRPLSPDAPPVVEARRRIERARARVGDWPRRGIAEALEAGLAKTWKRGRRRRDDALAAPTDEALHEWRKRVKYSWYHIRLLQDAAPVLLGPLAERLHDLSDALGDDHDRAVLRRTLRSDPAAFGGAAAVDAALRGLPERRERLQRRAFDLGLRLYVETKQAFARRVGGAVVAWRRHGAVTGDPGGRPVLAWDDA